MSTFLSKLVDECIAHDWIHADTLIVLPNQRAKKMLVHEIHARADVPKPTFLPEILSIENFLERLSPLRRATPLELLATLYEAYDPLVARTDKVEDFMRWADTFIKDISEMEMQMKPVVPILQDVAASKDFELHLGQDSLSQGQEQTIFFYSLLGELYEKFNDRLIQKKIAYPGLLYRDCAESIHQYSKQLPYRHIVFAGLYVLSASEQAIALYLKNHFDTHFYFDFDTFYCDFEQEPLFSTSYFLKEVCSTLSLDKNILQFKESCYEEQPKEIQLVGAPGKASQVFYAVQHLQSLEEKNVDALDETVVVLADESLLLPFLKAYDLQKINVTRGVPFSVTRSFTLLHHLLDLYQYGTAESADQTDKPIPLYHPVLSNILRNKLVQCLLPQDPTENETCLKAIAQKMNSQTVFFTHDDQLLSSLVPHFTTCRKEMLSQLTIYLQQLCDRMSPNAKDYKQMTMVLAVLAEVNEFSQSTGQSEMPFPVLRDLILQQVQSLTLPLEGDALKGLQVMGLLETRALDFKHVVILGANEGVLPKPIQYNSLLPFDYQYPGSDMPNYIYKDKISAYHFFRLLQRAEQVTLVYDTLTQRSLAEPSRFVSQLEFEVANRGLSHIHIHKTEVSFALQNEIVPIQIPKSDAILEKLHHYRFSASSLQDYVRCPLQFYLKDLCGLRNEEEESGVLQTNDIGTIVHKVFQGIFEEMKTSGSYLSYLQKLDPDTVETRWILPAMEEETGARGAEMEKGRFLLLKETVKSHVLAYLQTLPDELKDGDVTLLSFEEHVTCDYPYAIGDQQGLLHLKGFIDRLQKKGSHLMILDYKTGNVKNLKIKEDKLSKVFQSPDYDKLLQLFVYAELCMRTQDEPIRSLREQGVSDPICGIISTKECLTRRGKSSCLLTMDFNEQAYFDEKLLLEFEQYFNELIAEIFNPESVFKQAEELKNCTYCDFKILCHRS